MRFSMGSIAVLFLLVLSLLSCQSKDQEPAADQSSETKKTGLSKEELTWSYQDPSAGGDKSSTPRYSTGEKISAVNERVARRNTCRPEIASAGGLAGLWPQTGFSDPASAFARIMRRNGATNGRWAVLAIDPEAVEAAIQIAVAQQERGPTEIAALRSSALRQLFKPRAKSFVLMHNDEGDLPHLSAEPKLISMRQDEGRLVGMSVSMGMGLPAGKAGLLLFEDRTCPDDVSYALRLPVYVIVLNVTKGILFGDEVRHVRVVEQEYFPFEGEGNLLTFLAAALKRHAPERRVPETHTSTRRPAEVSFSDRIALASFALEVVKLLR